MILRVEKRERPFAIIDKAPFEDKRLSWRAKGVLAYLMTKPREWDIRMADLEANSGESAHITRGALRELKAAGYAALVRDRADKGGLFGSRWIVSDDPLLIAELLTDARRDGTKCNLGRDGTFPDSGKVPCLVNKEGETNNKKNGAIQPSGPEEPAPAPTPAPRTAPVAGVREGKASDMVPTTDQSRRVAGIMHRKLTTPWQSNEIAAYKKLGKVPDEDLAAVESYYAANWPPNRDSNMLRHDLLTLLNNFAGELGRAQTWRARQSISSRPQVTHANVM